MRDLTDELAELRRRLAEAEGYLDIARLRTERPRLETEASRPDLWDDPEAAKRVNGQLSALTEDIELFERITGDLDDVATLWELGREEDDDSVADEVDAAVAALRDEFDELELRSLFTQEYDERDAVCEVHSGAGGTDSQDWAEILLRMYQRWAERRGFSVEMDEASPGQEAGLSSATFIVKGRHAYGWLRGEGGVHRLIRISPFDSQARRHTAFASMMVVPALDDDDDDIEIDPTDLRIDTYRSSGAGGQHVNVTDSAVRITHLPTGIVTSCQNERSQHQNRDKAMSILKAKLADRRRQERRAQLDTLAGDQRSAEFGSQIRSYFLHPEQRVKDHRTNMEVGNIEGVLDGQVSGFMEGFLQWQRTATDPAESE
jgi:peptide chain release factor 2